MRWHHAVISGTVSLSICFLGGCSSGKAKEAEAISQGKESAKAASPPGMLPEGAADMKDMYQGAGGGKVDPKMVAPQYPGGNYPGMPKGGGPPGR